MKGSSNISSDEDFSIFTAPFFTSGLFFSIVIGTQFSVVSKVNFFGK
jgi:hypothetical protein